MTIDNGAVNLNGAHAGDLVNNAASWPKGTVSLILDGFTYDHILGFTNTKRRLDWLRRGAVWNGIFYPQPNVQLAKTLRAQGHNREARRMALEGKN
ncbi:MAG: hypothetical protein JKY94_06230 [Rhodobacteraceae bacterium]|nr:hypothetical protein [Paracoccaceae bacterium]